MKIVEVAPQVIRAFEAGSEGMEPICAGGRRPRSDDSERIPDFWAS
jgi:hypothetical protein